MPSAHQQPLELLRQVRATLWHMPERHRRTIGVRPQAADRGGTSPGLRVGARGAGAGVCRRRRTCRPAGARRPWWARGPPLSPRRASRSSSSDHSRSNRLIVPSAPAALSLLSILSALCCFFSALCSRHDGRTPYEAGLGSAARHGRHVTPSHSRIQNPVRVLHVQLY
eukprot:COSAG01_NODE_3121_length_6556_cov_4.914821_5_plen_168_part_00